MNVRYLLLTGLLSIAPLAQADFIYDVNQDNVGTASTLADFQVADAALDAGTAVNAINDKAGWDALSGGQTTGGLTMSTLSTSHNDGFPAAAASYTNGQAIIGSSLFTRDDQTDMGFTVTGLASESIGSTIVVTVYGIGDNRDASGGQQTHFTATFGGTVLDDDTQYNDVGEAQGSDTGSKPFVQFTFITDGVTDLLTVQSSASQLTGGNTERRFINGFSLSSTPVPEPGSLALIGLGGVMIACRRRRH